MRIILILAMSTLLFSCSKIKELEDRTENMEKTMEEMSSTTENMEGTMGDMNSTMGNMDNNMTSMYLQVRQKEGADTRAKEMAILMDPNVNMGEKLIAGKSFFYAFEYQLWTGIGIDDEEYREFMIEEAMNALYQKLADMHEKYNAASPMDIKEVGNNTKAFYAVATTMHFKNPHQEKNIERLKKLNKDINVEALSIYDIIKNALYKYNNPETAGDLTLAESLVIRGDNLQITEDLLNARMNFITALGMKDWVTSKDEMTLWELGRGALNRFTRGTWGRNFIRSNYEVQNVYTQNDIKEKLDGALKTRKILEDNGLKVKFDWMTKWVINNLSTPHRNRTDDGSQNQEDTEVYDMLDALKK